MRKEDKEYFESLGVDFESGFGYSYNHFAISEGIMIAEILRDEEKIKEFSESTWEEQIKLVPLSDNHSGGTFGIAIRSALLYLDKIKIDERDNKIDQIIEYKPNR
jgi:hypothetical protein